MYEMVPDISKCFQEIRAPELQIVRVCLYERNISGF